MQYKRKAIQDLYTDELAHCYGCGKNNPNGHQLKTYLVGDETIAHFTPDEKFTALPGSVYGGLVASLSLIATAQVLPQPLLVLQKILILKIMQQLFL